MSRGTEPVSPLPAAPGDQRGGFDCDFEEDCSTTGGGAGLGEVDQLARGATSAPTMSGTGVRMLVEHRGDGGCQAHQEADDGRASDHDGQ
jgi:hypothetical protein